MKYSKKLIIEDEGLFDGYKNVAKASKKLDVSQGYLSKVARGLLVVTEKQYLKMKKILNS